MPGAGTISQAKIYRLESSAQILLSYTAKKVIVLLQASISEANIYTGLKWLIYSQGLSETLRNWKRLYCTCIVRNTLGQFLQSSCCCLFKVSIRISVQQGLPFHNNFVPECKGWLEYRIEYMCDARDANYRKWCSIVESLLQLSCRTKTFWIFMPKLKQVQLKWCLGWLATMWGLLWVLKSP